jgi:hypothetical protein
LCWHHKIQSAYNGLVLPILLPYICTDSYALTVDILGFSYGIVSNKNCCVGAKDKFLCLYATSEKRHPTLRPHTTPLIWKNWQTVLVLIFMSCIQELKCWRCFSENFLCHKYWQLRVWLVDQVLRVRQLLKFCYFNFRNSELFYTNTILYQNYKLFKMYKCTAFYRSVTSFPIVPILWT